MAGDNPLAAQLDGDETLQYTQARRRKLVDTLTNQGTSSPSDPKDARTLLVALADMDKQVLGKKRLEIEEGGTKAALGVAAMIATLFNDPKAQSFNTTPMAEVVEGAGVTELPDTIVPTKVVAGELGALGGGDNYDSFMKRMKENRDAA